MRIFKRLEEGMKELTRRRLVVTGILIVAATILTAPSIASQVYHSAIQSHVPESIAEGRVFLSVCLTFGMWVLMGAVVLMQYLFFILPMCRNIASAYRALRDNLPKVKHWPSQLRSQFARFFRAVGDARSKGGAQFRKAKQALAKADPGAVLFIAISFAVLGSLMYLGWPIASKIVNKMPHWLTLDDMFFAKVWVDLFGSGIAFSFIMPFISIPLKHVLRRISRNKKTG